MWKWFASNFIAFGLSQGNRQHYQESIRRRGSRVDDGAQSERSHPVGATQA